MLGSLYLRGCLAAAVIVCSAAAAWAQSPFAVEMRTLQLQYHENPARLDAVREGLEEVVKIHPQLEDLLALAHVSFIWGDVRASTTDERFQAYERGRNAARQAMAMAPGNALAHFWYALNAGRLAQTRGVLRSLSGLAALRDAIQTTLRLDPNFAAAYAVAGYVSLDVPRFFGGDVDTAEGMFRRGLERDRHFTALRVGLAKTLVKKGRTDEARRELRTVLDERAPSNIADWTLRDRKEAQELLASLRDN